VVRAAKAQLQAQLQKEDRREEARNRLSERWAKSRADNYDSGDDRTTRRSDAPTKRVSLQALAGEIAEIKRTEQVMANSRDSKPQSHSPKNSEANSRLRYEVQAQAVELKDEQKEINLLKTIVSASVPKGKSFASFAAKALASAGYTGSRSDSERLDVEKRELDKGWAELRKRKDERSEREQAENDEFASISKRLEDLEAREASDRTTAVSSSDHAQHMKVTSTPDIAPCMRIHSCMVPLTFCS